MIMPLFHFALSTSAPLISLIFNLKIIFLKVPTVDVDANVIYDLALRG